MYKNYKNIELVNPAGLDLKDKLVGIQRVTKVTKGGRAFGFSAIVVVGDENGVVGHGLGKAKEVTTAISKAVEDAKKNLVRIPIENGTLPHEQKGKYGGSRVFIKPATQNVMKEAESKGYLSIFANAGAIIKQPACGQCEKCLA